MRRILLLAGGVLILAFIAIQAVPVSRTNPPEPAPLAAPDEVEGLLDRACADCHSHRTRWPWYSRIAPVSWLVAHDVEEAREHLNFSTWGDLAPRRQDRLREEMWEEVSEGEMPLAAYRLAHPEARLTEADLARLNAWARGAGNRD